MLAFGSGSNLPSFSNISHKLLQPALPEASIPSPLTPMKQAEQDSSVTVTAEMHAGEDVIDMTMPMESPFSADGGLLMNNVQLPRKL